MPVWLDGDIVDLPELVRLAEQYDALLSVDDAHGFGVLGAWCCRVAEHCGVQSPRFVVMVTLRKAAKQQGRRGHFSQATPESWN